MSKGDGFNTFKNTFVRGHSRMIIGLGYADNAYLLRFLIHLAACSRYLIQAWKAN